MSVKHLYKNSLNLNLKVSVSPFRLVQILDDFETQNSNTYHSYLLTEDGVSDSPVISNVGPQHRSTIMGL